MSVLISIAAIAGAIGVMRRLWVIYDHRYWVGMLAKMENPPFEADPFNTVASLLHRANEQHEQVLRGDPRGIYGKYPPADLT